MTETTDQSIAIACAADENYAMPLAVTVHSLLTHLNHGATLTLFILDGGITASQKRRILKSIDPERAEVNWIQPFRNLGNLPISEKYPPSTYYRLLLPQVIPDSLKKIIYLDTDIVVKGDLKQLWDIDLQSQYALAVQDICHRYISQTHHLDAEKFGISSDCKYFNSGVMVINLEKWRSERIGERTLEFIQQYPECILFADQDALNISLAGMWGELDPRWNQMHAIHEYSSWQESIYQEDVYEQVIHHPYIVHYTTPPKPWQKGCKHPQQDLFFRYLDLTAWHGWRNTIWRRLWNRIKRRSVQSRHKTTVR